MLHISVYRFDYIADVKMGVTGRITSMIIDIYKVK